MSYLIILLQLGCVTPSTDKPNEQATSSEVSNQKSSTPYIVVVATYLNLKLGQKDTKLQRLNLANEKGSIGIVFLKKLVQKNVNDLQGRMSLILRENVFKAFQSLQDNMDMARHH